MPGLEKAPSVLGLCKSGRWGAVVGGEGARDAGRERELAGGDEWEDVFKID